MSQTKTVLPAMNLSSAYTSNNANNTNPNVMIFAIPTKGEIKQVMTNCNAYACFDAEGKPLVGGKCNWCGDKFDTPRLGIALQTAEYEGEQNYNLPISLRAKHIGKMLIIYYESCSCCFECALAETIARRNNCPPSSIYYANAERNLRFMFNLAYPNEELRPADDYLLHKNYDGPLSREEFHSRHHYYVQIPTVIWAPVKGVHEVKNVSL